LAIKKSANFIPPWKRPLSVRPTKSGQNFRKDFKQRSAFSKLSTWFFDLPRVPQRDSASRFETLIFPRFFVEGRCIFRRHSASFDIEPLALARPLLIEQR
jgi:hypothetical protein